MKQYKLPKWAQEFVGTNKTALFDAATKRDRAAFDKAWEETVIKPLKERGLLKEENDDHKRN